MRRGFQAMMREALQKKVDIVMAEALDRFSRDQEDTAGPFQAPHPAWKPQRCSEG
jgi:hypothetical protein